MLSPLFLQTFQKADDGEEESDADEKSPLAKQLSDSSLFRRKSTRGSSVTSDARKEERKSFKKDNDKEQDKDKADEVSSVSISPFN